jgi:hypothetical protein
LLAGEISAFPAMKIWPSLIPSQHRYGTEVDRCASLREIDRL